jgi:hypothetical protein
MSQASTLLCTIILTITAFKDIEAVQTTITIRCTKLTGVQTRTVYLITFLSWMVASDLSLPLLSFSVLIFIFVRFTNVRWDADVDVFENSVLIKLL